MIILTHSQTDNDDKLRGRGGTINDNMNQGGVTNDELRRRPAPAMMGDGWQLVDGNG